MQCSEYTTSERLKALRGAMTQEQLAEAAGVRRRRRKLERGGTASLPSLLSIADALGTDSGGVADAEFLPQWSVRGFANAALSSGRRRGGAGGGRPPRPAPPAPGPPPPGGGGGGEEKKRTPP
ncbi:helix-turn-helix domain-containing protein, partial [Streptomyces sp. NPDC056632]|uniref:helix-turn-helix domain-containing protein n=1 Tax=Streptomyces sp. NPDC056632 TaxID=3345884 RepID=UPI0036A40B13